MRRLHITNGDSAADILKRSSIPGDVLPWRDPMHHGPFPAGLDLADASVLRARYLSGPDIDSAEAERGFRLRDQHLQASTGYDTILLWFEHDLLDQLQILQILDWFHASDLGDTDLQMICIDSFPGMPRFRGIGELDTDQIATLLVQQRKVTEEALAVAASTWAAFRSFDPRDLLKCLSGDLDALPFLAAALWRHVEEYPATRTGLSRTEAQLLGLVGEGVHSPGALFRQNMELETVLYIGDWATYATLDRLCAGGLLSCDPAPFEFPPVSSIDHGAFGEQRFELTEKGRAVLSGAGDAHALMNRDCWIGGVHLGKNDRVWTWDADAARFVHRVP
ncbi:MAG: hypothetical protein AAGB10_03980 [Pseudomonadota bacterium]